MNSLNNLRKTLIIGGIKSGKSSYALSLGNSLNISHKIFVATSQPFDDEMKEKIRRHQKERGKTWLTVECPLELPDIINKYKDNYDQVILVDCLTMWINNMLYEKWSETKIMSYFDKTIALIKEANSHFIVVSNDVGSSILPADKISREFTNYLGILNQKCAKDFSRVIFMLAGCPVIVK